MDESSMIFDSRKSILEDIMKNLRDSTKNSIIGIYGFGGMGKTTLAKQVASRAAKEKMFEKVVMASVTQRVGVKQIQGQIASMLLDLKLEEFTIAERAKRIHQRLKGKKVLVILDDLWDELDLKEVGVPFGPEYMGCKILLTSRFRHVLISMGTEKDFYLFALEDEEAWRLFEKKAGSVLENSDFHNIGEEVAKRCQGLPVLIVTVAATLSKRPELPAWNDALNQLKKMNHKEIHDIVNSAIESISYNHLEKTHKRLFVLCGVIGGVASIQEVFQYSLGWDLFDQETGTIQEARDRLHTLILDLKESCLLLDVDERNSIKMHDLVRDVAISIGRKDSGMLSIREYGAELNIWHKVDDLKRCPAMVLRGCPDFFGLPSHLKCPSLELFVMSGLSKYSSPSIPQDFFEKTSKLKVLGLSQLSFTAMPPSISFLKNLQALRVNDCDSLKDISIVGELKKLQTLSLSGYGIEELPSGIWQLSELRSLDVKGCSELKLIPAGLIEGLTRLEELYVSREFYKWEADVCVNGTVKTNASLRELKNLHNLCSLEVRAGDDKFLLEDLHFEKLERYEIIVGDKWEEYLWLHKEFTRKFCLQLSTTSINHLQKICNGPLMKESLCCLTSLTVEKCNSLKVLFTPSIAICLVRLQELTVKQCAMTTEIVATEEETGVETVSFPQLRYLCLAELANLRAFYSGVEKNSRKSLQPLLSLFNEKVKFPNLERLEISGLDSINTIWQICNGRLMEGSFCNLTKLIVEKCDSLNYLFTPSIAIEEETIIETVLIPQLRYLCLEELTNLTTFYSGVEEMNSNKSGQPLFNEKVKIPNLRRLEISGLDSITTIWHNHLFEEDSFFQLKQITVKNCASLLNIFPSFMSKLTCLKEVTLFQCGGVKHIFPISMAASFHWLEKLTIEDCEVETIFDDLEEIEIEAEVEFVFSKLYRLYLRRLPKLECFYPREHTIQCPALKEFRISNCDKISALNFLNFQGNQFQKVVSNLEFLSIRGRDIMKMEREDGHLPPNAFATVERLVIKDFDDKSASFPSKFLHRFEKVTRLSLYDCSFKEIFPYEGDGSLVVSDGAKKLRELKLSKLPELESICKQDSPLIPILENLILSLQVWECPRLTNLVPSSVSFRVLTHLEICNCGGLINLIQSPITTMAQLQVLRVGGCEMLEAIIAGDESGHDIIFYELRVLELEDLPSLRNFCRFPYYNFEFPLLEEVNVKECPSMETFCGGTTITPKLNKVYTNRCLTKEHWEGDLNTTIQKIFAEKEALRLTARLPATSSGSHFVELTEPGKESQSYEIGNKVEVLKNATDPRKEDKICENHITKLGNKAQDTQEEESEAVEHCENSKETIHHSDPSHNTAQEQTVEGSLITSQRTVDSSSRSSPPITSIATASSQQEIEEECIQEAKEEIKQECERKLEEKEQTMLKRRSNEFEVCENVIEPRKEDMISEDHVKDLGDKAEICEDAINPENEVEVSEPRKETEICEETIHFQEQTITASIGSQRVVDTSSQSIPPMGNNPDINPSLATETTTSIATASSQQKDLLKIIDDEASPDISAMVPNVDKANKGLLVENRAKAISKRRYKLAEIAAKLQELEETKKALEDEYQEELMASRKLGEGSWLVSPAYIEQKIEERIQEAKEEIKQEYERKLEEKEQAMHKRMSEYDQKWSKLIAVMREATSSLNDEHE